MPNSSITDQPSSLRSLPKEALAGIWRELLGAAPPTQLRKELMLQFLAYRIQEQKFGALSDRIRRRLVQITKTIESDFTNVLVSEAGNQGWNASHSTVEGRSAYRERRRGEIRVQR